MSGPAGFEELDSADSLAGMRSRFYLPADRLYFDGNSLGLLSDASERAILRALELWKHAGIEGWTQEPEPWYFMAERLAAQIAPLVGAEPDEVIVANSTTVNLHQIIATLYTCDPERPRILADSLAFPSDLYALQSQLKLHGRDPETDLILVKSRDGSTLRESDIIEQMSRAVQLAVLPSVLYRSGQLLDMALLTREAHKRGVMIGFDCAHSVGVVPHALDTYGVDFAVWCSYKYLNGGPGAAGGLYLNRRHFDRAPGLAGWFSSRKDAQFQMSQKLTRADSAGALQIGSPNILSMAPLTGSIEIIAAAGIDRIRAKSLALTDYLIFLVDTELTPHGLTLRTPRDHDRRGGHVALSHPEAARICRALRDAGVVPDFRPPDVIRLAPAPLYASFRDCHEAAMRLKQIMEAEKYARYPEERSIVT